MPAVIFTKTLSTHTKYTPNHFYWYKTHKRLKERFLTGWNRTERAHFSKSSPFQAMYLENLHVLSCFVQLKSVLIICVFLGFFFRMAVTSISDFFLHFYCCLKDIWMLKSGCSLTSPTHDCLCVPLWAPGDVIHKKSSLIFNVWECFLWSAVSVCTTENSAI